MDEHARLTPAQFARRAGLSLGYVYQLLWDGRVSADKVDGAWAIPVSELERKLQSREVSA
jgi:hypothetical protein